MMKPPPSPISPPSAPPTRPTTSASTACMKAGYPSAPSFSSRAALLRLCYRARRRPDVIADAFADYPKTVVLKDGEHIILRPLATVEDAALRALLARAAPPERLVTRGDPIIVAWDGERA